MKKFLSLTLLIGFWVIFPTFAQQTPEPTPPFPPNPEDIFAEGVNWVLVENQPDEITNSSSGIIESACVNAFPQNDNRSGLWQWHIVYDPELQKQVVCFDETLATYDILLDGYEEWRVYGNPNNEWLIIIGQDFDSSSDYQIFSHHLSTGQQNYLGRKRMSIDTSVGVDDWLTDTQGVLYSSIYNYKSPSASYYRFNVEVPDSLEFVLSGGEFDRNLVKIDSPKRYVAFYSGGMGLNDEHYPCRLVILDATGIYRHELGYECIETHFFDGEETIPFYRFGDDIIYYITISQEDDNLAELHRYDTHHLPNESLYSPEPLFVNQFERVLSVSPDEQYIVLQMSDDDVINDSYIGWGCCMVNDRYPLSIISYTRPATEYDYGRVRLRHETEPLVIGYDEQLIWLDNQTLLIHSFRVDECYTYSRYGCEGNFMPPSLRRITFTESSVQTSILFDYSIIGDDDPYDDIFGRNLLSPNKRYFQMVNSILDLQTFQNVHLFKDGVLDMYKVEFRWVSNTDEDIISVSLIPKDDSISGGVYHITLP